MIGCSVPVDPPTPPSVSGTWTGVSKIQTECHPRSRLPVLSKNTNELSFSYAATSVKLDGSCDGVSSCSVLGHLRFVNVLGFVSMARG